jgi:hypothetical protein
VCSAEKYQERCKKNAEFYAYFISGEKIAKKFTLKKSKILIQKVL